MLLARVLRSRAWRVEVHRTFRMQASRSSKYVDRNGTCPVRGTLGAWSIACPSVPAVMSTRNEENAMRIDSARISVSMFLVLCGCASRLDSGADLEETGELVTSGSTYNLKLPLL